MKGTVIEVVALTLKGRESLAVQKSDELALRLKYKGVVRWKIPRDVRRYLKTVSLFSPKDGPPESHKILGFGRMGLSEKHSFYQGVKASMSENGCSIADFEVKFHDE